MSDIKKNMAEIRERMDTAAKKAHRDPASVVLVAVSKRHSVEAIVEAYEAGQRDFGENYAQELRDKSKELAELKDIRWHFIGNLQRNKIKYVADSVSLLETVDSVRLVEELDKHAQKHNRIIECLIQVNVGEEEQKSGCTAEDAADILEAIKASKNLKPAGLMTIPPWDLESEQTRIYFKTLKKLREEMGGVEVLPHLSMGMSHDFEVAIEEGATYVRVGTAIFGERPPRLV